MQAQQEFRINAAPLSATFVLFVGLAFGAIGGYAIGTAVRSPVAIPSAQPVATRAPTVYRAPASSPTFDEGRMCTIDFTVCREPQNSYD